MASCHASWRLRHCDRDCDELAVTTAPTAASRRARAPDAVVRANKVWKKMLAEYEAPALDPGTDESILEFIAKKKASMPDAFA